MADTLKELHLTSYCLVVAAAFKKERFAVFGGALCIPALNSP